MCCGVCCLCLIAMKWRWKRELNTNNTQHTTAQQESRYPKSWNEEKRTTHASFTSLSCVLFIHFISWSNRSPFVFLLSLLFNGLKRSEGSEKGAKGEKNKEERWKWMMKKRPTKRTKGKITHFHLYFALWYFVWVFFFHSPFHLITAVRRGKWQPGRVRLQPLCGVMKEKWMEERSVLHSFTHSLPSFVPFHFSLHHQSSAHSQQGSVRVCSVVVVLHSVKIMLPLCSIIF